MAKSIDDQLIAEMKKQGAVLPDDLRRESGVDEVPADIVFVDGQGDISKKSK